MDNNHARYNGQHQNGRPRNQAPAGSNYTLITVLLGFILFWTSGLTLMLINMKSQDQLPGPRLHQVPVKLHPPNQLQQHQPTSSQPSKHKAPPRQTQDMDIDDACNECGENHNDVFFRIVPHKEYDRQRNCCPDRECERPVQKKKDCDYEKYKFREMYRKYKEDQAKQGKVKSCLKRKR